MLPTFFRARTEASAFGTNFELLDGAHDLVTRLFLYKMRRIDGARDGRDADTGFLCHVINSGRMCGHSCSPKSKSPHGSVCQDPSHHALWAFIPSPRLGGAP